MTIYLVHDTDPSADTSLRETVTAGDFGANFLATQLPTGSDPATLAALVTALQQLTLSGLRWPGGTVTDQTFDFRHENAPVMNGSSVTTQHQFFATAGQLQCDVTLTLETRDGFTQGAATALADGSYGNRQVSDQYLADMKAYVERSLADAVASGTHITMIELGNEFWGGGQMTATEYGRLACALLTTVNDALNEALPEGQPRPGIALQDLYAAGYMSPAATSTVYVLNGQVYAQPVAGGTAYVIAGQGTAWLQSLRIADEVTGRAEGGTDLSHLVTAMTGHFVPAGGLATVDGDGEAFLFRQFTAMEQRLGFTAGTLDRSITEWSPARFVDANHDGINDIAADNRGMPQAAMMVHMMYEMVTHGVTSADIWPLYFSTVNLTNLIGNSTFDVRVPGAAFRMMSAALVGTTPLFSFEQTDAAVQMSVHGFSNAHRLVLLTANQSDAAALGTVLDLSGVSDAALQARMDHGSYFITTTRLNAVDAHGNPDSGQTALNVLPVLSYSNGTMATGHQVTLGDLAAWDLSRTEITFVSDAADQVIGRGGNDLIWGLGGNDLLIGNLGQDTLNGGIGNDTLLGGAGHDLLLGSYGDDLLSGGAGNDLLFGGFGNDLVLGGLGNDSLAGGAGDDVLTGNSGADVFVFANGFGTDTVTDFNRAAGDRINLHGLTGVDDVTSYAAVLAHAHQVGDAVHIVFSSGEVILDLTALADLTTGTFIL